MSPSGCVRTKYHAALLFKFRWLMGEKAVLLPKVELYMETVGSSQGSLHWSLKFYKEA